MGEWLHLLFERQDVNLEKEIMTAFDIMSIAYNILHAPNLADDDRYEVD